MRFARLLTVLALAGLGCTADEGGSGVSNGGVGGTGQPIAGATAGTGAGIGGFSGAAGLGGAGGVGGVAGTINDMPGGAGGMGGVGGGGTGGAGGMLGGTGGAGGAGGMVASGPTLSATMEVLHVEPGDQLTVCTTKFLDNETEVKVKAVRGHISGGSHHFIVDRAPTDVPIEGLTPCVGLSGADSTRVLIAEKPETIFAMPEGVGFTLRPHQALTTELHYFNPTDATIDVHATIELELAEGEEAQNLKEAQMVFTGNFSIYLPAHMPGVVDFFYPMPGSPEAPAHVFALTSHTHSLGTRATIARSPDALSDGTQLHESLDWSEPPLTEFSPAIEFTGSDGLRLRCEYMNDTDYDVSFGTAFEDEMCFMWLYYY